jgi:HAD superfamily hydrolase (TIGR01509 family)
MGKGKRDPDLFPDITEQLALSPSEILLVDDIKSNVERAQAAGWQAIHYVDKASYLAMIDKILQSSNKG